jgi:hypothetical protein
MEQPMSEWHLIPGYPNYRIASDGRVLSINSGKVMRPADNGRGYLFIPLRNADGKRQHYIHSLVALVFHGPRPDGGEVNHRDGNKRNNHADNIEYSTRSENVAHAYRLGLRKAWITCGEMTPLRKITRADAAHVRVLRQQGATNGDIGSWFGIGTSQVSRICRNHAWAAQGAS